jgi:hypothetical protein
MRACVFGGLCMQACGPAAGAVATAAAGRRWAASSPPGEWAVPRRVRRAPPPAWQLHVRAHQQERCQEVSSRARPAATDACPQAVVGPRMAPRRRRDGPRWGRGSVAIQAALRAPRRRRRYRRRSWLARPPAAQSIARRGRGLRRAFARALGCSRAGERGGTPRIGAAAAGAAAPAAQCRAPLRAARAGPPGLPRRPGCRSPCAAARLPVAGSSPERATGRRTAIARGRGRRQGADRLPRRPRGPRREWVGGGGASPGRSHAVRACGARARPLAPPGGRPAPPAAAGAAEGVGWGRRRVAGAVACGAGLRRACAAAAAGRGPTGSPGGRGGRGGSGLGAEARQPGSGAFCVTRPTPLAMCRALCSFVSAACALDRLPAADAARGGPM